MTEAGPPMKLLLIDNYDSFTYNLVQAFAALGVEPLVYRNDAISVEEAQRLAPDRLVISPGPCTPRESRVSLDLLRCFAGNIPVLGVCLGHQAMAEAFGGAWGPAPRLMHGKTSEVHHDGRTIYRGLSQPFTATRYHSLIVTELPPGFERTAWTAEGELMGMRHPAWRMEGVQFHPESYMTVEGNRLLANFLD